MTLRLTESPDPPTPLPGDPGSFFTTPSWWRATTRAALAPDERPVFVTVQQDEQPVAVFPMLRTPTGWRSLTTLYTYRYEPIGAAGFDAFARWCKGKGVVRLDSLDPDAPSHATLLTAIRGAGLIPLPFDHFGIWEEPVTGQSWDDYARGRDGRLRETIRRRLRDVRADPDAAFSLTHGSDGIDAAIAAYHAVEPRSWKQPEPFPDFNRVLFREAAADGHLFMATLTRAGTPIAVQAWVLHKGRATVLKLVHDEAETQRSPGTVLTALVIQHLLKDRDLDWLDFGRGDDAYKKSWVSQRRQRVGLLIADPWRPSGLAAIARHALGRWKRRTLPSAPPSP